MKNTKKLALSAILVALGTVFMVIGAFVEVLDLTVCAFSSLIVAFVYIEIGSPYTWLVWLATSACTAMLGGVLWIEYLLIFGIYPIIKGYIERLRRVWWLPLKLAFAALSCVLLHFGSLLVVGQSVFAAESKLLLAITLVLLVVAFIAYDLFITVLVRFYCAKLRSRFKKLLK